MHYSKLLTASLVSSSEINIIWICVLNYIQNQFQPFHNSGFFIPAISPIIILTNNLEKHCLGNGMRESHMQTPQYYPLLTVHFLLFIYEWPQYACAWLIGLCSYNHRLILSVSPIYLLCRSHPYKHPVVYVAPGLWIFSLAWWHHIPSFC